MFKSASRMLFLAPAVTFGMGAAFVLSSFALGMSPQNPTVWHAFIVLAPLTRDPVNLIDSIPGVGYGTAFVVFSLLTAGSLLMAFTSWGSDRLRFVASHMALLPLVYSMGSVSMSYSSVGAATPLPLYERFSRSIDFASPSMMLLTLLVLVLAAAAWTHVEIFAKIIVTENARISVNREYKRLLGGFIR